MAHVFLRMSRVSAILATTLTRIALKGRGAASRREKALEKRGDFFFSRGLRCRTYTVVLLYTHCSVPSEKLHDASKGCLARLASLGSLGTRDWQAVAWVNERRHAILLKESRSQQCNRSSGAAAGTQTP